MNLGSGLHQQSSGTMEHVQPAHPDVVTLAFCLVGFDGHLS